MDEISNWHELIERARNFYGDNEEFINYAKTDEDFLKEFYGLYQHIKFELDSLRKPDMDILLKTIFRSIYAFIATTDTDFLVFLTDTDIHNKVFDASYFMALSMYIHHTKRLQGKSLRRFVYENSLSNYKDKKSMNYFDFEASTDDIFLNEESTLRKARNRLLSTKNTYIKRSEWSAMSKDSEHNWKLYFDLELDNENADTYKRFGNLYNDVNKAIMTPISNVNYIEDLKEAFKKFESKLKKIKYDNFIKLQQKIFSQISEDSKYYGFNIYRLENSFMAYKIIHKVKLLAECENENEIIEIVNKFLIMQNIPYTKLYRVFDEIEDLELLSFYVQDFLALLNDVVILSRLIIDKFIEDGYLGDDWENLFINTIEELTPNVFYNPNDIDFSVTPERQEMYYLLNHDTTWFTVYAHIQQARVYNSQE